jgi:hypothetical protein
VRSGIVVMTLALAACGSGNGEGLDQNGVPEGQASLTGCIVPPTPPSTPPPPGAPLAPTLASIQANVFSVQCAVPGCHGGSSAQQGMQLDPGFAFGNLVCVRLPRDPSQIRVIPFDPDNSFIIHKLEGTQNIGDRMPDGGPYLDQPTIDVIRQWIANGASQ